MKSLTIIQETRAGLLAEVATLLEHHKIDLRSIDGSTAGSLAVISLIAEPYDECFKVLNDAGFKVFANEQVLVRITDHPGALAELSRRLANVQVDIRSIHIVQNEGETCIVALETENDFSAKQVLGDILV
ncbi:MAG: hypothetical protein ACI9CB_002023 [Rhodothermales bacterium]|jgi:hypothetical protein